MSVTNINEARQRRNNATVEIFTLPPAPTTTTADWQIVRAQLLGLGAPEAQIEIAETPGGIWEAVNQTPGFRVTQTLPVLINWIGADPAQHNRHMIALKEALENEGYDLATKGPREHIYLAVYSRIVEG